MIRVRPRAAELYVARRWVVGTVLRSAEWDVPREICEADGVTITLRRPKGRGKYGYSTVKSLPADVESV